MAKVEKKWKILDRVGFVGESLGLPSWLLNILAARGITTTEEIELFLNPSYEALYSPFDFLCMDNVVSRMAEAKEKGEKVAVYGDYDVDGISATAIMFEALNKIGVHDTETYIPHREEEGYGLNEAAVSELKKKGVTLIISVDCGITSRDVIDPSGVDFIVCDHHEIEKERLPQKAIIVHPRLVKKGVKEESLCGGGMAFFIAKALSERFPEEFPPGQEKWLLDLAALATICDVVPLVGQNRILAKWGLLVLAKSKRPGLAALFQAAGIEQEKAGSYEVGFLLGPRLNAAGRLETAKRSLNLLLTRDKAEAVKIAGELNKLNTERQKLCERIIEEAKQKIESGKKDSPAFILSDKSWSRGVVGIVASRISDQYARPTIIFEDDGEVCHGSARSVEGFDITEALYECKEHLLKFGGHAKAAGLSLESTKMKAFESCFQEIAKEKIKGESLSPVITVDAELDPKDADDNLMGYLAMLDPFGYGNKTPVFVTYGKELSGASFVGQNKNHLKCSVEGKPGIFFSCELEIKDEKKYNLLFTPRYNEWNNRKNIELRISDAKVAEGKLAQEIC